MRLPLFTALCLTVPAVAMANDFVIYSPKVAAGQNEFEARGFYYQDGNPGTDGEFGYNVSAAHAFTSWWKPEIYFLNGEHEPGGVTRLEGFEFENTFQLAPVGRFFVTPGFLFAYEASTVAGAPDKAEFGPLFERQDGRFIQRLNLIWEREIGGGASGKPGFRTTYSLTYRWRLPLQPTLEAYLRPSDDSYQVGPMVYGELYTSGGVEIEYQLGAVIGTNRAAPDTTWIGRFEYEFF